MPTDVVYIDEIGTLFADYRREAEKNFQSFVLAKYGDRFGDDVSFEWAQQSGHLDLVEEAIWDDWPLWCTEEAYLREQAQERYDSLLGGIEDHLPKEVKLTTAGSALADDPGASVIATGKHAQIVVRNWEGNLYVGVGPTNAAEALGALPDNKPLDACVAKIWAACEPRNTAYYEAAGGRPAPIEMLPAERALLRGVEPNGRALHAVLDRVCAMARESLNFASGDEALKQFTDDFGIGAEELVGMHDEIEDVLECIRTCGVTPTMLRENYAHEAMVLSESVLSAMADLELKPGRPDSAWTGKVVDLSAYRIGAAIQVDAKEFRSLVHGGPSGGRLSILRAKPWDVSVMSEAQLDAEVMPLVLAENPVQRLQDGDGKYALYAAGPLTTDGGVLVYRGPKADSQCQQLHRVREQWVPMSGGLVSRDAMPMWMPAVQTGAGARAVLAEADVPPDLAKDFYDSQGNLSVTGVVAERRGDRLETVLVTKASNPLHPEAKYQAVKIDGQWRDAAGPAPRGELSYG